jgi:hypothetical protein
MNFFEFLVSHQLLHWLYMFNIILAISVFLNIETRIFNLRLKLRRAFRGYETNRRRAFFKL